MKHVLFIIRMSCFVSMLYTMQHCAINKIRYMSKTVYYNAQGQSFLSKPDGDYVQVQSVRGALVLIYHNDHTVLESAQKSISVYTSANDTTSNFSTLPEALHFLNNYKKP